MEKDGPSACPQPVAFPSSCSTPAQILTVSDLRGICRDSPPSKLYAQLFHRQPPLGPGVGVSEVHFTLRRLDLWRKPVQVLKVAQRHLGAQFRGQHSKYDLEGTAWMQDATTDSRVGVWAGQELLPKSKDVTTPACLV